MAETKVYRSGGTWLVVRGDVARVVGPDGRVRGVPVPLGSAMAHLHAAEGWAEAPEAGWPPAVARVAAAEGGWELPDSFRP